MRTSSTVDTATDLLPPPGDPSHTPSWQDLKDVGRSVGDVCHADISRSSGEGVLEFSNKSDMLRAVRKLDGCACSPTRLHSSPGGPPSIRPLHPGVPCPYTKPLNTPRSSHSIACGSMPSSWLLSQSPLLHLPTTGRSSATPSTAPRSVCACLGTARSSAPFRGRGESPPLPSPLPDSLQNIPHVERLTSHFMRIAYAGVCVCARLLCGKVLMPYVCGSGRGPSPSSAAPAAPAPAAARGHGGAPAPGPGATAGESCNVV
jgi:hypothetical protein